MLKFSNLVHLQNYLFMVQLEQNENLAKFFVSIVEITTVTKQEQ